MKDVIINEGETLTLEVEVYAVPEPKIVWFKDGQEVRADARIKIQRDSQRSETYNLTLNLIKREEAGIYELKASNTLGTAVSKSVVTVHSKCENLSFRFINFSNQKKVRFILNEHRTKRISNRSVNQLVSGLIKCSIRFQWS